MQLIRGLHNLNLYLKNLHHGSVVTIGSYDGIHLGHQAILQSVQQQAKTQNVSSVVITFYPQPREFFVKDNQHQRLINLREKLSELKKYHINYVLCLHFNKKLANLSAINFITKLLVAKLKIKCLVIGSDFAFGHKRYGNLELIEKYTTQYNFKLIIVPPVIIDKQRVSSTLIRNALMQGNLKIVQKFLGKPYSICGPIIHGNKLGRRLNFPTANIHLHHKLVPLSGVYAIRAYGLNISPLNGIANIGFRPTIGDNKRLLEIYLLDFNQTIYGKLVRVEFLRKIRDERRFTNFAELKKQISKDVAQVKQYFQKNLTE